MKELYPWVCELTPDELWRAVLEYSAKKIGLPQDQTETIVVRGQDKCELAIVRGQSLCVKFFDGYPECHIQPLVSKTAEQINEDYDIPY